MNQSVYSYCSLDDYRQPTQHKRTIVFHLLSILVALVFLSPIIYSIVNQNSDNGCFYSPSETQITKDGSKYDDAINVGMRYSVILYIMGVFHFIEIVRGFLGMVKVLLEKRLKNNNYQINQKKEGATDDYIRQDSSLMNRYVDSKTGRTYTCYKQYSDYTSLQRINQTLQFFVFNDFFFIIGFILMNMFVSGQSSEACQQPGYLKDQGEFLTLLLKTYWSIIFAFVVGCLCYRCLLARDDSLVSVNDLDKEDIQMINSPEFQSDIRYFKRNQNNKHHSNKKEQNEV
eukprot:403353486